MPAQSAALFRFGHRLRLMAHNLVVGRLGHRCRRNRCAGCRRGRLRARLCCGLGGCICLCRHQWSLGRWSVLCQETGTVSDESCAPQRRVTLYRFIRPMCGLAANIGHFGSSWRVHDASRGLCRRWSASHLARCTVGITTASSGMSRASKKKRRNSLSCPAVLTFELLNQPGASPATAGGHSRERGLVGHQ